MTQHQNGLSPRPPSAFRAADGSAPTVAESVLLAFSALADCVFLDSSGVVGPVEAEREVRGSDIVAAIRQLTASADGRQTLLRLVRPSTVPQLERAAVQLGYAGVMIREEQASQSDNCHTDKDEEHEEERP
ncbi:MAG: hypothetical protein OXH13_08315 [Chloroflexi bacterium]|nr:hypothetical protein [Chloroflexota bacterium]MCY3696846.1 hypothetical protein [Chloroflexota bacterium]